MGRAPRAAIAALAALGTLGAAPACTHTKTAALHGPPADPPGACVGGALRPFVAPADLGPGGLMVTVSGEALAVEGYAFRPGTSRAADPAFVDGWSLRFEHVLTSFDRVTLSADPDGDPNDELLAGDVVQEAHGPWAYDLAHPSARAMAGKGGAPEKADPIVAFGGLDAGAKYAFGYETVPAQACAVDVNLDDEGRKLWSEMVSQGYSVYFVGTATYAGDASCTAAGGHDFSSLPTVVRFRLGFRSPTAYVNCQNPDLEGPPSSAFEEAPRGVQAKEGSTALAQMTFHTDHLFWDRLAHDAPLHFDPFAAAATTDGAGFLVTSASLSSSDYDGFRLPTGAPLPPRSCVPDFAPLPGPQLRYDPAGVSLRGSLEDFVTYSQSTDGHLDSDGLCAVFRRYPSPR